MSEKRKRVVLGFNQKLEIIKRLKAGETATSIAQIYGVGRTTVNDMKRDADKIEQHVSKMQSTDGDVKTRKTMKPAKFDQLDNAMYQWFIQARSRGIPLSGPMIMTQAVEMNKKLEGDPHFKASIGWLDKFKFRHGIRQLDIGGDKLTANSNILNYDDIVCSVTTTAEEDIDDDEGSVLNQKPTTSHSEAETMLSKCIDWFEMQEEANATEILLLRKIWNIASQKARASKTQKETTDYFKNENIPGHNVPDSIMIVKEEDIYETDDSDIYTEALNDSSRLVDTPYTRLCEDVVLPDLSVKHEESVVKNNDIGDQDASLTPAVSHGSQADMIETQIICLGEIKSEETSVQSEDSGESCDADLHCTVSENQQSMHTSHGSDVATHATRQTTDKTFRCDVCDSWFTTASSLKSHTRTHTADTDYTCDDYAVTGHQKKDRSIRTEDKSYKCDICGVAYTKKYTLTVHKRKHTGERPYKCDDCDVSFTNNSSLIMHKRIHTGERPYKCDDCGIGFTCKSYLTKHSVIHTVERPHTCDDCGVEFARNKDLVRHKAVHTGERPHTCDDCGLSCTSKSSLTSHKKIHTGDKPFKCEYCGVGYTYKRYLKRHQIKHMGETPYKCDECGLGILSHSQLMEHKRIHTGEKPYKCDCCGLGFVRERSVMAHKRTHTGERPYKCDECGKGFTDKRILFIHNRMHTGERPYKCDECGKSYTCRSNLIRHQATHTEKDLTRVNIVQ